MATDNPYTTDSILSDMRLRGYFSEGKGLTDSNALSVMKGEMDLYVPAFLKPLREEYLVTSLDLPLGEVTYVDAPRRAVGAGLRTVEWVASDGRAVPMTRVEPERVGEHAISGSVPSGYVLRGNRVQTVPKVESGTVRLSFMRRPGRLVLRSACAEVTAVSGSVLTVSSVPSGISTGVELDVVSSVPNFDLLAMDVTGTVGSATVTFASAVEGVQAGDFVCLANQTCIPPVPYELHHLLAQRTAEVLLQAMGSSRYAAAKQGRVDAEEQARRLLTPRVDGSKRLVVSRYGPGRR